MSHLDTFDFLVTDDLRTHLVATRMGIPVLILPDLIVELARRGRLTADQALRIIEVSQTRYSEGILAHTKAKLEELPRKRTSEEAAEPKTEEAQEEEGAEDRG